MKKVYTLKEIVGFAMANSSFYGELYKNIDPENFQLKDLPVIEQEKFWMANNISENSLLTGAISDGIVLKSGGTTGHPKFSIFTKTEWENFTQIFERAIEITQTRKSMDMEAVVNELQLQTKRRTMEIKRELDIAMIRSYAYASASNTFGGDLERRTMAGMSERASRASSRAISVQQVSSSWTLIGKNRLMGS